MAVSKRARFEVLRRDEYTCRYCRATDQPLTVDHVTPVALGGTDDPGNLVAACRDCNAGKASTGPDEGTVADVSETAVRWASALKQAAEQLEHESDAERDLLAPLYAEFRTWLPTDWDATVRGWLRSGLTLRDATECLGVALAKPYVRHDAVFAYACGIARNKIRVIQDRARIILDGGGA